MIMNNEIKEILDRLERIDHKKYKTAFEFADSAEFDEMASCFEERMIMADYITNLQEIEKDHQKLNGELREENKILNNIIDELEKYLKEESEKLHNIVGDNFTTIGQSVYQEVLDKLKELKG